jgi:hypothetical protein
MCERERERQRDARTQTRIYYVHTTGTYSLICLFLFKRIALLRIILLIP